MEDFVEIWIPILNLVGAGIGGFLALAGAGIGGYFTIRTYVRNSRLREAEWLHSLFEKFYHDSKYTKVRRILDHESSPELELLRHSLAENESQVEDFDTKQAEGRNALEEEVIDYLNFFEFIAILNALKQLSPKEIHMMFGYYLGRLRDDKVIMGYIQRERNSFENLAGMLAPGAPRPDPS